MDNIVLHVQKEVALDGESGKKVSGIDGSRLFSLELTDILLCSLRAPFFEQDATGDASGTSSTGS